MLNEADIAILCLPDAAAIEAVNLIEDKDTRVIDASTAHRTAEGWAYGFAELDSDQREKNCRVPSGLPIPAAIRRAISPSCGRLSMQASFQPTSRPRSMPFPAIRAEARGMIAEYEREEEPVTVPYWPYGLTLAHKHVPEMTFYAGLEHPPVFQPAVGRYAQGMIDAVPLNLWALDSAPQAC